MNTSISFTQWKTGHRPITTNTVTLASGQGVLPEKTPLGQNSTTGAYHKWAPAASDGTQKAVAILQAEVDATTSVQANVWDGGSFNPEMVAWPVGATAAQKATAFVGTPIQLKGAD